MFSTFRSRIGLVIILTVLLFSLALFTSSSYAKPKDPVYTVGSVELIGELIFETGYQFNDTEVGGLSGIVYDKYRGVYHALSDDKSEFYPARFYSLDIDLSDGSLDDGDIVFTKVTYLRDHTGRRYETDTIDPEGFEMAQPGIFFIGSEGNIDREPAADPFIDRFNPAGKQNRALPIPDKFVPGEEMGARRNLVYESLAASPNLKYLYAATENALWQDGPIPTIDNGSPSRVIAYNLKQKRPGSEYVYCVSPIPQQVPGSYADNGLVELVALDNHGTFLAMERSYAEGIGNTVVLFETSIQGATDVSGIDALGLEDCPDGDDIIPMSKTKVVDLGGDLGTDLDNLEGMTFGPLLPDGRLPLIIVSDNNFGTNQKTLFIVLAVELVPVSE